MTQYIDRLSIWFERASRVLRAGGLVAYPTEAVWGLGCDPWSGAAVRRLLTTKGRSADQGLILVSGDRTDFAPWLSNLRQPIIKCVIGSWPGPVTWIVPNRGIAPTWITGKHSGVALRVSSHPVVSALCRDFGGPLVSTSANPTGRRPAISALDVRRYFSTSIDLILPGEVGGESRPSTIIDAETGEILRD